MPEAGHLASYLSGSFFSFPFSLRSSGDTIIIDSNSRPDYHRMHNIQIHQFVKYK
jgi:hypothetical protein